MPGVKINIDYCKGCDLCVQVCPTHILAMSKEINLKGYLYARLIEPTNCIGCQLCAIMCPDVAITIQSHGTRFVLFE